MRGGTAGTWWVTRFIWTVNLLVIALALGGVSGCGGCSWTAPQAKNDPTKQKKKPEKPKPLFDAIKIALQPSDELPPIMAKPGHWASATLRTRANHFDFSGELDAAIVDKIGQPLELDRTPFRLATSRPVSLPKGQQRYFDVGFFIPRGGLTSRLNCVLRDRRSGAEARPPEMALFSHMPAYQYYFFVLSRHADRYRYIAHLDSVRLPGDITLNTGSVEMYYRVVTPMIKEGRPILLPAHATSWTSMAYLLWDDVGPHLLSTDQREALVDWLHWGGQLIISGPQTLDALHGSFLDAYLPARSLGATTLKAADLQALSDHWTLPNKKGEKEPLQAVRPWLAVKLQKHPAATYLPGAEGLVAERRVGRGRIVVSAFRLDQRDLLNWRSYDSFFNACILRRGPRVFSEGNDLTLTVTWADNPQERFDPARTTKLRIFSRDAGRVDAETKETDPRYPNQVAQVQQRVRPGAPVPDPNDPDAELLSGEIPNRYIGEPGMAGWNDFSGPSDAARKSLKDAAGITVPKRSFVLNVVALYLLVIVPLNWFLFWMIGRVELAWAAAPVIAVLCAIMVVWLAQLDIGFARSTTDIAVLELHGGHPRAHVTRYTALYTSLSTTYDLDFDEPSAVAAPLPTSADFRLVSGQSSGLVTYRRDSKVHLTDLDVSSNSTQMVHTEYVRDLGGTIDWIPADGGKLARVHNGTSQALTQIGIVRRPNQDELQTLQFCWLGNLKAGDTAPVNFSGYDRAALSKLRELSPATSAAPARGTLNLKQLVDLAEQTDQLEPGQVRLIGLTDADVGGVQITPEAAQRRTATLVVANLHFEPMPAPYPDNNLRSSAKTLPDEDAEPEDLPDPDPSLEE